MSARSPRVAPRSNETATHRKSRINCAVEAQDVTKSYRSPACFMHEFEPDQAPVRACDVHIKRVYDKPARADGFRVLVDRIWPRGIKREQAALDAWSRTLAPSTELRKWFRAATVGGRRWYGPGRLCLSRDRSRGGSPG